MARLDGRVALVTGAGGYLGKTICKALIDMGASLIITDCHESSLKSVKEEFDLIAPNKIKMKQCDLGCQKSRESLVQYILNECDSIDILVNNAAFVSANSLDGWTTKFTHQSLDTWRNAFEVNLTSIFDLSKCFAQKLASKKNGSIINIGSIYGINAPDYSIYEGTAMGSSAAYASSKGGLLQLTRWLSTTLAPEIRVNAISPGGIKRDQDKKFIQKYEARTPLGRMASEEDFIGIVVFLASDLSAYVTGQNIVIDGGWTI